MLLWLKKNEHLFLPHYLMPNNQILIVPDLQPPEVAKLLKTYKTLRNSVFTLRNSAVKKSINSHLTLL